MSGVCDFCTAPEIAWCYPANGFELEPYRWRSVGDWAACCACSELIEAGEMVALAERSRESSQTPGVSPRIHELTLSILLAMHAAFMTNRTGPRRPL